MSNEIIFLQTHVDFYQDTSSIDISTPVILIFGNKPDGSPIQLRVHGFLPYFYIHPLTSAEINLNDLKSALEHLVTKGKIIDIEAVERKSIYGYEEHDSTFYKLTFNSPLVFTSAKNAIDNGVFIRNQRVHFKCFESNFPHVLRFMIDLDMVGMSYIRVMDYVVESSDPHVISASYENIQALPVEGKYLALPPMKILSIDIECTGHNSSFPNSKIDPVIQIGNTVVFNNVTSKTIFCLKETSSIPGSDVLWFEDEESLLIAWKDYFLKVNPDIIIGYNIKNFDLPYILDRADILKIKDFDLLARTSKPMRIRESVQSSNAFGSMAISEVDIDGRLVFDLYQVIKREYKLRSYSLNSVSLHFLQEQKEDVPYTSIAELQNGDKDTRRRIASYCLRDTYLPIRLFNKLNVLVNYTELARVTGVPLEYFSTRGVSIKILALIYRAAKDLYLIPAIDVSEVERTFEGGFVMDPIKGFYRNPIAVLDFNSLYPSIMISKNLCYTTLLNECQYEALGGICTPTRNYFCTQETKRGLLPSILLNLLDARKKIKEMLKEEADDNMRKALDARQLALKICANSLYGFTGAKLGKLPCLEISQSVTAFGRELICETKRLIEKLYCKDKGFNFDACVIYGDTDSVMISYDNLELSEASDSNEKHPDNNMGPDGLSCDKELVTKTQYNGTNAAVMRVIFKMSKEISEFISSKFIKPVKLEFEKVYCPYLLISKKRYAGLIYTNPNFPSKIDTKGIETVRRDNCELVKNVIQTCLDKILFDKDVEGAKSFVKETVRDLYLGKIDLSQLVISKAITKNKYVGKQAHTELAQKLKKRDEGMAPVLGDRVAYVIVKGAKNAAAYEKSEDPVYVLENNLPIDTEYYLEQQLSKPIHRLFEPVMDNVSELLKGEHTRQVVVSAPLKGPMNAFITKKTQCVGCKVPGDIICKECRKEYGKHYLKLQSEIEEKKSLFNECWVECQRCQGSIHNEVICVNRDCPIFYMRTKVKKEIAPLSKRFEKLSKFDW